MKCASWILLGCGIVTALSPFPPTGKLNVLAGVSPSPLDEAHKKSLSSNKLLVQLKPSADMAAAKASILSKGSKIVGTQVIGQYRVLVVEPPASATMARDSLTSSSFISSIKGISGIENVQRNGVVRDFYATQRNEPWGLHRTTVRRVNRDYVYDDNA
jgi:hypothetical protein